MKTKIWPFFLSLLSSTTLAQTDLSIPRNVEDPFQGKNHILKSSEEIKQEELLRERQEERSEQDPLGEFGPNPAEDQGNSTTTNQRIKWPEP